MSIDAAAPELISQPDAGWRVELHSDDEGPIGVVLKLPRGGELALTAARAETLAQELASAVVAITGDFAWPVER